MNALISNAAAPSSKSALGAAKVAELRRAITMSSMLTTVSRRLNVPMVRQRAKQMLSGQHVDLQRLATRHWQLCPATEVRSRPALMPPGSMERILSFSPLTHPEHELAMLRGALIRHDASIGHVVEGATIAGAFLYVGAARWHAGMGEEHLLVKGPRPEPVFLEEATLRCSYTSSNYFGCMMLDAAPLALIDEHSEGSIVLPGRPYSHEAGYRSLLGLSQPEVVSRGWVQRLTLYTDHAQNDYKRRRYLELRARLRSRLGPRPAGSSRPMVYIGRGTAGEARVLVNEDGVIRALRDRGFTIIDPSTMSAEEIARASLDASIVVGVEGSQLAHTIFSMADDAAFLVIQPPTRVAMAFKEFTDCVGMTFAMVVADPAEKGFSMPIDTLLRMVDTLDRRVAVA